MSLPVIHAPFTPFRKPGAPRWEVEQSEDINDRTGERYYTFTPVLTSCMCSPVRFAVWQASASDPAACTRAMENALAGAKEALRLIAAEA